jgi:hypothetical protein
MNKSNSLSISRSISSHDDFLMLPDSKNVNTTTVTTPSINSPSQPVTNMSSASRDIGNNLVATLGSNNNEVHDGEILKGMINDFKEARDEFWSMTKRLKEISVGTSLVTPPSTDPHVVNSSSSLLSFDAASSIKEAKEILTQLMQALQAENHHDDRNIENKDLMKLAIEKLHAANSTEILKFVESVEGGKFLEENFKLEHGDVTHLIAILKTVAITANVVRNVTSSAVPKEIKEVVSQLVQALQAGNHHDDKNVDGKNLMKLAIEKLHAVNPTEILNFVDSSEGKQFLKENFKLEAADVTQIVAILRTVEITANVVKNASAPTVTTGSVGSVILNGVRGGASHLSGYLLPTAIAAGIPNTTLRAIVMGLSSVAPQVWALHDQMLRQSKEHKEKPSVPVRVLQWASGLLPIALTATTSILIGTNVIPDNADTQAAAAVFGVGGAARTIKELVKSYTQSSITAPVVLMEIVDGVPQPLSKKHQEVVNIIDDVLYVSASIVVLAVGGSVGGATIAGLGLTGAGATATGVLSQAAAANMYPAILEAFRDWAPNIAAPIAGIIFGEEFEVRPDTQTHPGLDMSHFQEHVSARLSPGVVLDMIEMAINLSKGMGAPLAAITTLSILKGIVTGLLDNHRWLYNLTDETKTSSGLLTKMVEKGSAAITALASLSGNSGKPPLLKDVEQPLISTDNNLPVTENKEKHEDPKGNSTVNMDLKHSLLFPDEKSGDGKIIENDSHVNA